MKTQHLLPHEFMLAIHLLKAGELVAVPTETVYGLAAALFDPNAIEKIFEAKARPKDNPLIVHCADTAEARKLVVDPPALFYQLAAAFWPGPLTMVLKKQNNIPSIVAAGLASVAVRVPDHPLTLQLIQALGEPIVAPSANCSGYPSPTAASHVLADLSGKIAAVLDGGECTLGIESTVVDLQGEVPVILRPGIITREQLTAVTGITFLEYQGSAAEDQVSSPGLKYRHYAPEARVCIVSSWAHAHALLAEESPCKRKILANESQKTEGDTIVKPLLANTLYAEFRDADQQAIKEVIVICDEKIREDRGLYNRIMKAGEAFTCHPERSARDDSRCLRSLL